ncbi:NADH dehydrogenase subunit [Natrialbaceae archaeon A-gly3]
MSTTHETLGDLEVPELAVTLRNAGVAGAGGAGFPTYAKWEHLESVETLLVNHQESEPNYYIDKWLGRERTGELAALFDAFLEKGMFDRIVVGAKATDREEWTRDLEAATEGTVYEPDELPIDPEEESGVVFAYTDDRYEYGMESVLLRLVADVVVGGDELPVDHGWIVQNTETLYNVYRAVTDGKPTTRKFVHVDGRVPEHRFLEVPIGTPASELLAAAGREEGLRDDEVLLDGGPGWCFEIEDDPEEFGVRKRTNGLLVMDRRIVEENTLGNGRVNVLGPSAWKEASHETEPTETLSPDRVNVPLITNPAFEGLVTPSEPIVDPGETVEVGEMIARPGEGISIAQHAPIAGTVREVAGDAIVLERRGKRAEESEQHRVYWTSCTECGRYVPAPEVTGEATDYVCVNCR